MTHRIAPSPQPVEVAAFSPVMNVCFAPAVETSRTPDGTTTRDGSWTVEFVFEYQSE